MAFAAALPHEVPAIIKKFRLKSHDAQWWQRELASVTALLSDMTPPDLSNTLWAAAKVPCPQGVSRLFKSAEPHILKHISLYAPHDLALVAGAYAQASVPSQSMFPHIAANVDRVKANCTFEPTDYVTLLQAFAKVRSKTAEILSLSKDLTGWVRHLYPRDVAATVWSLGHLSAGASVADPFIEEALSAKESLNVVDVCNLAYGLGKMKGSARHLGALGAIAVPLLPKMGPNHVATLTWACGKARALPKEFGPHIARTARTYGIRDVIFVIQGIQAAGATTETWAAVCARIGELAPTMRKIDAVHIIPALPKCPEIALCEPVINALDSLLTSLKMNDGIFVLQALSVLKLRPSCWDTIEKDLSDGFPGKVPLAQWILCLSALDEGGELFIAILRELEANLTWAESFRDIVTMLQISTIGTYPIWSTAADAFRMQIPRLPLNTQWLQGCIELVRRDYHTKEILGVVIGRLQNLTQPLNASEIELIAMLLEEVDYFDLQAWEILVENWKNLDSRPPEFLASCAKIHFRPDISISSVQPAQTFFDLARLLQVLVKLDYAHLIPWKQWLFCVQNQPLKTLALFLHTTAFAHGSMHPAVIEAFEALPKVEWDLYSAAQILTALLHWHPDILRLRRPQLQNMVSLLEWAEKGALKRDRSSENRTDGFHHDVLDSLSTVFFRKVMCEIQAGPYALDIVVYT